MDRLKARGHEEIFRVERTRPSESPSVAEIHEYRALMSDGNILGRMVMHYNSKSSHDYGWKVEGLAKENLSLEQLLKSYLDQGWKLSKISNNYFTMQDNVIEAISQEPFRNAWKDERRRELREHWKRYNR